MTGDAAAGVTDGIREEVCGAELSSVTLDLADLSSIRAAAEHLGGRPIDLLVNSAGVMYTPFERTADGFDCSSAPTIWATSCSPPCCRT